MKWQLSIHIIFFQYDLSLSKSLEPQQREERTDLCFRCNRGASWRPESWSESQRLKLFSTADDPIFLTLSLSLIETRRKDWCGSAERSSGWVDNREVEQEKCLPGIKPVAWHRSRLRVNNHTETVCSEHNRSQQTQEVSTSYRWTVTWPPVNGMTPSEWPSTLQ